MKTGVNVFLDASDHDTIMVMMPDIRTYFSREAARVFRDALTAAIEIDDDKEATR